MAISTKGNLPKPLSAFIGRKREVNELKRLLSEYHLVTLTGAGGSGKTRLSIRVANEFVDEFERGIWFIEFAPLADNSLVPQAVASVLGVREQTARPLTDELIAYLQNRHTMLIFDNCEHLIAACAALVEKLLQTSPKLWILATSRESLGVPGEVIWTIPPLSLPDVQPWRDTKSVQTALPAYGQSEAVQLFVQRAASVLPDFQLRLENGAWVAEICRRLDGMPLAIELAAARVRTLSVQQIAQKLDDRFHLLTGGGRTAPHRQQTLLSTLDWSYALLSDREQKVLQRLSVFAGGATMEAAEAACAGEGVESVEVLDALSHLVDKSLVTASRSERDGIRYGLFETIRQYASQKLEGSGGLDESKDRYLNYFVPWAEKAELDLNRDDELLWLERYEVEYDNLRSVLEWSRTSEDKVDLGLRLAQCLVPFWHRRGYYNEGREQLAALLKKMKGNDRSELRAKALYDAGGLAFVQTDYPATRMLVEESLSIYRELGAGSRSGLASVLIELGDMWRQMGSYEKAFSLLEEGLRLMRELNDLNGLVIALWQLGYYSVSTGNYQQAEQYFTEGLQLARQENAQTNTAVILSGLAECAVRQRDYKRAARFEEESLKQRREIGEKWGIAVSLGNFAWIALHQEELGKAQTLLMESFTLRREVQDQGGMAWCLEKLAKINILYGQKKPQKQSIDNFYRATHLFSAAAALRAPVGSVIDQADQPQYDHDLETLKTALGQEAFSNLWIEGEVMSLEEVISVVLDDSPKEKFGGLTAREREVAVWIAQGKSNREIARAMTVSEKTIETYVTRILNKLGFDSRVKIAMWARDKGLV